MSIRRGSLMALAVLVMVAMLGSACGSGGAPAAPPPTPAPPTPGGNRPPVISGLTAAKMQVYPSGSSEIQCVASDPDGDQVRFTWAATGGKFSGAGPTVVWQAPATYGTYNITITVDDGKGGTAQATIAMSVVANHPPQISSLVANPSSVIYGGSTTITCIATDADGDVVTYNWSASEGTVTGVGNVVTYVAPNKGGNFNVMVLVSDGKGGETRGNVMIAVSATTKTVVVNPVAQETGTVDSKGDKDASRTMAGDDEKNVGYRAFWSFNIFSLVNTNIQSAKLKFTTRNIVGDPFPFTAGLGGLTLWDVKYGGNLPDFNITGGKLERASASMTQPPTEVDVTPEMNRLIQATATRFQVEAWFTRATNGNDVAEWIDWSSVVLEVSYTDK